MPLTLQSCPRTSTSGVNSFRNTSCHTNNVKIQTVTSNGFEVQNSKTRNIKPLASSLKPKLRIPTEEYPKFKEMMENLNINETKKTVRFNITEPLTNTGSLTSSAITKSALYDDDTDLVPFEEFEPWSLQLEALIKNRGN